MMMTDLERATLTIADVEKLYASEEGLVSRYSGKRRVSSAVVKKEVERGLG